MRLVLPIIFLLFIWNSKYRNSKKIYIIAVSAYFLFLSFRFMQGTDYTQYFRLYTLERTLPQVMNSGFRHGDFELLYNLSVSIAKTLNVSFYVFIAIINAVVLMLMTRFFNHFSKNNLLSLLLLYLLYGIVFIESAIRQSIAIAIILGISLVAFQKKDIKGLVLGTILAFLFHRSSILISLIIVLLYYIYYRYSEEEIQKFLASKIKILGVLFVMVMILINIIPYDLIFSQLGGTFAYKLTYYFSAANPSIISLATRLFFLGLLIYFYKNNNIQLFKRENIIFLLYLMGFLLYLIVVRFSIMSRITVYFEILEIAVYSHFIFQSFKKDTVYKILIGCYCFVSLGLFVKDGIVTQQQSRYRDVSIIYPYYTIFDESKASKNIMPDYKPYDKSLPDNYNRLKRY